MALKPRKQSKFGSKKSLISIGLIGLLVGVGVWGILTSVFGGAHAGNSAQTSATTLLLTQPVSPLLFGTNMGLFNSNDQVLTSATTRSLLQQMHTRIIRMPVRSTLSEATEIAAAQMIKSIGAIPLVVLRGAVDATVLADDSRIVNDMNNIFGNNLVFYEYGNEEDLLGVDVTGYTASWNAVVPQLKHIALQGQFVGPVNFQYNRTYLTTFLQHANPRPDEVSWHEYTCDDSWSSQICISHIANWTNHFNDARSAMTAAIGTALPIMITEWNYAPNAVPNDGKNNDSAFMSTWTSTALQTLAANRIYASMQYSCTNTAIPMISSGNAPTVQGLAFQGVYQQIILGGQQPTPPPAPTTVPGQPQPTPPGGVKPTPMPTQTGPTSLYSSFSFEDSGTDGWSGHGSEVSSVQNGTTVAKDGKHSLQISLMNVGTGDFPFVSAGQSNLASYPQAGQTITIYVYVPATNAAVNLGAKIFVMDGQYHWFDPDAMTQLKPGQWNQLTFTLPAISSGQLRQLGIQFNNLGTSLLSTSVFIDAVSWK
jgi:hypothetical protein